MERLRGVYGEVVTRLKEEFQRIEGEIRRRYEGEMGRLQEETLDTLEVMVYKPCPLGADWMKKIRDISGKIEFKLIDLNKLKHNSSTHTISCSSFS